MKMSAPGDSFMNLPALWGEASIQIDALTHNRAIKLAMSTFKKLGIHGQHYFKQEASLALNGPADFYADETNPNRVYLGLGADFVHQYGLTISQRLGCPLPVLSSAPIHAFQNPHIQQQAPSFLNSQAQSQTGYHGFNYPPPPEAPAYPIQSPGHMAIMPPMPGPSSARKRNANGQSVRNNALAIAQPLGSVNNNGGDEGEHANEENHIKRPPNAFMFFRQEHAPIVARENPGVHNGEISKLVSAKWRRLSREEQQPWYDRQAEAAEEHKRLHPGWKFTPGQKKGGRPAKRARLNAPQPQGLQQPLNAGQPQYMVVPQQLVQVQQPEQPQGSHQGQHTDLMDLDFYQNGNQLGEEQFLFDLPPVEFDQAINNALRDYEAESGNPANNNSGLFPIEMNQGLGEIQPDAVDNNGQPSEDQYKDLEMDFLAM